MIYKCLILIIFIELSLIFGFFVVINIDKIDKIEFN